MSTSKRHRLGDPTFTSQQHSVCAAANGRPADATDGPSAAVGVPKQDEYPYHKWVSCLRTLSPGPSSPRSLLRRSPPASRSRPGTPRASCPRHRSGSAEAMRAPSAGRNARRELHGSFSQSPARAGGRSPSRESIRTPAASSSPPRFARAPGRSTSSIGRSPPRFLPTPGEVYRGVPGGLPSSVRSRSATPSPRGPMRRSPHRSGSRERWARGADRSPDGDGFERVLIDDAGEAWVVVRPAGHDDYRLLGTDDGALGGSGISDSAVAAPRSQQRRSDGYGAQLDAAPGTGQRRVRNDPNFVFSNVPGTGTPPNASPSRSLAGSGRPSPSGPALNSTASTGRFSPGHVYTETTRTVERTPGSTTVVEFFDPRTAAHAQGGSPVEAMGSARRAASRTTPDAQRLHGTAAEVGSNPRYLPSTHATPGGVIIEYEAADGTSLQHSNAPGGHRDGPQNCLGGGGASSQRQPGAHQSLQRHQPRGVALPYETAPSRPQAAPAADDSVGVDGDDGPSFGSRRPRRGRRTAAIAGDADEEPAVVPIGPGQHRVLRGETWASIARLHMAEPGELRGANPGAGGSATKPAVGAILNIP